MAWCGEMVKIAKAVPLPSSSPVHVGSTESIRGPVSATETEVQPSYGPVVEPVCDMSVRNGMEPSQVYQGIQSSLVPQGARPNRVQHGMELTQLRHGMESGHQQKIMLEYTQQSFGSPRVPSSPMVLPLPSHPLLASNIAMPSHPVLTSAPAQGIVQ